MATSYIIAKTAAAPYWYVWSETDGVFTYRGIPSLTNHQTGNERAFYSASGKYLIVFRQTPSAGFMAYEVNPDTGIPLTNTAKHAYLPGVLVANSDYVSFSGDRTRIVVGLNTPAKSGRVLRFSDEGGFSVEQDIAWPGSVNAFPRFHFPKNSNDLILGYDQDAAAGPDATFVRFQRTDSTWGSAESQALGNATKPSLFFDTVEIPGGIIRLMAYGTTNNTRQYSEFYKAGGVPIRSGTFGSVNATYNRRSVTASPDGRRFFTAASSTSAHSDRVIFWEIGEHPSVNNTVSTNVTFASKIAYSPRDTKAGLGDDARSIAGRYSNANPRLVLRTAWNTDAAIPGTTPNSTVEYVDWSPDKYEFNPLTLAATLGKMRAALLGGPAVQATMGASANAMVASIEAWRTVTGDVGGTLGALSASFGLDVIEPSPMPDTDVFIEDYEFRQVTSEAPQAFTSWPHFGYFDGAKLPAITASIYSGGNFDATVDVVMAAMVSDGFVRFPIETSFTGVLRGLKSNGEVFVDNFRDVEFDASLAAMSADALGYQTKVAELGGTMPALVADILSFRPVHSELDGLLAAMSADALAVQTKVAELDATLAAVKSGGNVWVGYGVNPSIKLPALRSSFSGFQTKVAQLGATLPAILSDIEVFPNRYRDVEIAASMKAIRGAFEGGPDEGALFEATMPAIQAAAEAWVEVWGDMASTLSPMAVEGELYLHPGVLDLGLLPSMRSDVEVWQDIHGELGGNLRPMRSDIEVWQDVHGELDLALSPMRSEIEVWQDIHGELGGNLPRLRSQFAIRMNNPGSVEASLGAIASDILAAMDYDALVAAQLPRFRSDVTVGVEGFGNIVARLPRMSADVALRAHPGVLDLGTLPALRADALAVQIKVGELVGRMPAIRGELVGFPDGAAFIETAMPALTSEIWVGPPNQVDMNARLASMKSFFYGGWPTETTVDSVLPGMQSFFLGGQPNDFVIDTTLAALRSLIEVEGLPADNNQIGPVDFDGGLETERFSISGAVIFGFGKTFP